MPDPELAAVLARLQELEDERAILRLCYRYAHAYFSGDTEQFKSCFAPDATIEHSRRGVLGRGPEELGAFFDTITHAPAEYHKHVIIEPIIDITGDTATVVADYFYLQGNDDGPFVASFGHYDDQMVRGADGEWRFRRRVITTEVKTASV